MKIEELEENGSPVTDYLNDLTRVVFRFESQIQYGSAARIAGKAMVEGLAHDLKNPLAVLHSCCQFLSEDKKLTSRSKENVQWMKENIEKANKLISQFLAFGRVRLTFQPIDINECIRKAWEITLLHNGNHKILFHSQLAEALPEVFGDYEKIEGAFFNLFQNALEAVSEVSPAGKVTAETRFLSPRNMVEVGIMDNGPGIPAKIREKVFRPYFTTKKTGKGLGLYLTKHFIQHHKGEISIKNRPGGGTRVSLRLPVFPEPEQP